MDYVKGRPPNYQTPGGSPALMETSVNQTWAIQQSTTGLLTPLSQPSTALPAHDVPQEQLSSTKLPTSLSQPRKALKAIHDPEMQLQQQQPRKRLRIQPNINSENNNNNGKLQAMDNIQHNGQVVDDLDATTQFERLQISVPDNNAPDRPSLQNLHAPPAKITAVTPKIKIINRKETTGTQYTLETSTQDIFRIFTSVIDGTFNNLHFEIAQQNFYEICSFACSSIPTQDIFTVVSDALQDNVEKICRKMEALASEKVNFLSVVVLGWEQCLSVLVKINDLFNPLNSRHIIQETKYLSLFHVGKAKYVNMLSISSKIKTRTIISLTHLISCQRSQIHVDQDLITSTLRIIHENLPIYAAEFGTELMHSTRRFYQKCATIGLNRLTMRDYMTYALKLIVCEPTAIYDYRHYIPDNIESPSKIALEELLSKYPDHILGCFALTAQKGQKQLLKALYQLFTPYGDISLLQTAFEQYIISECDEVFSDYGIDNKGQTTDDQAQYGRFVSAILGLKSRLNSIVDRCFDSNDAFRHSLKKSFEASINRDPTSSAQHIAVYMSHLLESITVFSSTAHSSAINSLDQCIDLVKNLQAEDVFKCFYKVYLARRLLMYRNKATLMKEVDMTERLQSECGVDFAKDLFVMINEVRTSQSRMAKFEEVASSLRAPGTLDISVNVLTGEIWSIPQQKEELTLPPVMLAQQQAYNQFYRHENPRTELFWMGSISTCVVNASYPKCAIELHTTQHQAMILLLFNQRKTAYWTVKQISQQTGIGESNVIKSLETLSTPEIPLLIRRRPPAIKNPSNISKNDSAAWKDDSDVFAYNQNFNSTQTTIHFTNMLEDLPHSSIKVINRQELFSRRERIQASIMKILKEHKTLDIMEILDLVKARYKLGPQKFLVRLSLVEGELQGLMQRCLIRRSAENTYEYCAE